MCNPASFVMTEKRVYWSKKSNSHEDIISEFQLEELDQPTNVQLVRVEITPPNNDFTAKQSLWSFKTDQDILPKWYLPKDAERRIRRALKDWRTWWFSTQIAGNGSTQTAGYNSTQTAGNGSTQTAGDGSTQTAGYKATQTAGDISTQTAGYNSTQTAGNGSTQTAGDGSTQTAGYIATQTAGYIATQTAGYNSTQTAGNGSTQTAGNGSTQTAGNGSTQTAGDGTLQIVRYYNNGWQCFHRVITEKEANKPYKFYNETWNEVKND